jgi:hypothetical protein
MCPVAAALVFLMRVLSTYLFMHVTTTRCGSGCAGADYAHGSYNRVYPMPGHTELQEEGKLSEKCGGEGGMFLGSITKEKAEMAAQDGRTYLSP